MTFSPTLWNALWLSLKLATLTTVVLLLWATPLAWWLARTRSVWRLPVQSVLTLPLVLPPTVLGFYLLVLLSPQSALGQTLAAWGVPPLVFSFPGLLLGAVVSSMPFALQPLVQASELMGPRPLEVAATLRARPVDAFFTVALPMARHGVLTAALMSFAHTLGEFGVVLMVGGNIPGQTQVLSTLLYGQVEAMDYQQAHLLAAGLVVFALAVLMALGHLRRQGGRG